MHRVPSALCSRYRTNCVTGAIGVRSDEVHTETQAWLEQITLWMSSTKAGDI